MEKAILQEISKLLEKTGLEDLSALNFPTNGNSEQYLDATLIYLKSLNARYEKDEALSQVQWLMNKYNIQIDEVIERIGSR